MTETRPEFYEWKLCAKTALWTGDVDRKGDRVITTGLLGSIRWWFEVLVRGLGGSACDPTDERKRCPSSGTSAGDPRHHCAVCELFGCTDWARKFRFDVLGDDSTPRHEQIRAGDAFVLRFIPLRSVRREEWTLIDLTLRLTADYGAIGGKTVLKPPNPDYGIVTLDLDQRPSIAPVPRLELESYLSDWPKQPRMWASLENFWFVKRCLDRTEFNHFLVGTSGSGRGGNRRDNFGRWIRGQKGESKKIFSFKNPGRTFGFIDPSIQGSSYEEIQRRLKAQWQDLHDDDFLTGPSIVDLLFQSH